MKTIGIIGGTGWVSSLEYYRMINQQTNMRLGGIHAAQIILYSFNYQNIYNLNQKNDHEGVFSMVLDAARKLENAGADGILLGANTLHYYAENLQKKISLPIIHIAEATADEILKKKIKQVALLGTKITMEEDFYIKTLENHSITALTPDKSDRDYIHQAIFNELLKEQFKENTKERFLQIIKNLQAKGAEGVVLGCTEIPLLISQDDTPLPVLHTTKIHASAAVDFILNKE